MHHEITKLDIAKQAEDAAPPSTTTETTEPGSLAGVIVVFIVLIISIFCNTPAIGTLETVRFAGILQLGLLPAGVIAWAMGNRRTGIQLLLGVVMMIIVDLFTLPYWAFVNYYKYKF